MKLAKQNIGNTLLSTAFLCADKMKHPLEAEEGASEFSLILAADCPGGNLK